MASEHVFCFRGGLVVYEPSPSLKSMTEVVAEYFALRSIKKLPESMAFIASGNDAPPG